MTDNAEPAIVRNAILAVVGIAALGLLALRGTATYRASKVAPSASASAAPPPAPPAPSGPHRRPLALTEEEQAKGHWECSLPDPGNGSFGPVTKLPGGGLVQIPKTGGHTEDFGFDVLVHFHGFAPVRKGVVRANVPIVFAGYDLGNGSGPYAERLAVPQVFADMQRDIVAAIRAQVGDERAHVRNLGLSAWSAGYGAVSAILRNGDGEVSAVILLDGLHASFLNGAPRGTVDTIEGLTVAPIVAFAQRAAAGEKLFYFSHSAIATEGYASTSLLAELLLRRVGVRPRAAEPTDDPLGLLSYVDEQGFHQRAFGGNDKRAHCDHTRNIEEALVQLVAPAWKTPPFVAP